MLSLALVDFGFDSAGYIGAMSPFPHSESVLVTGL